MEIRVLEFDVYRLADLNRCDSSFTVDARLVLDAHGGRISYHVESVAPFIKEYLPEKFNAAEYLSTPMRIIYLAYLDGHVAGQVRLRQNWNRYAYIEDLAVHPPFRRLGLGSALIEQASTWARQRGCPGMMLETQDINLSACRLYEQAGFILGGFDTNLYRLLDGVKDEIALYWYLDFE